MKEKILELRKQGKTHKEICEIVGCSKGTVSFHCNPTSNKKQKIRQKIKKGTVCESELDWIDGEKQGYENKISGKRLDYERLVGQNKTLEEISQYFGVAKSTAIYWLKKFGLNAAHKWTKRVKRCKNCGESNESCLVLHRGKRRNVCVSCFKKTHKRNKEAAVAYKGGKCQKCGYNKSMAALEFHHVNPSEKDPDWIKVRNYSLERQKPQLDKCVLLCSNCHRETHESLRLDVDGD